MQKLYLDFNEFDDCHGVAELFIMKHLVELSLSYCSISNVSQFTNGESML